MAAIGGGQLGLIGLHVQQMSYLPRRTAILHVGYDLGSAAHASDKTPRFAPNRPGIFALASSSRANLIFLRDWKKSPVLQSEISRPIN